MPESALSVLLYGAGERNRTLDLLITSELLYRLSYSGNENLLRLFKEHAVL